MNEASDPVANPDSAPSADIDGTEAEVQQSEAPTQPLGVVGEEGEAGDPGTQGDVGPADAVPDTSPTPVEQECPTCEQTDFSEASDEFPSPERVTSEQVRAEMTNVQTETITVFGKPMTVTSIQMSNCFVLTEHTQNRPRNI